jgi:hypothetical protein
MREVMGAYGLATWARVGRCIADKYARYGSPLHALEQTQPRFSPPVLAAEAPEYLAAQRAFADARTWFGVQRLDAKSHFPPLEVPDETAAAIEGFVAG